MKKTVLLLLALLALAVSAGAQDTETIPAYRTRGYKGNVSLTSLGLYWEGIETSHGYMCNDRLYIGAGAGVLFGTVWDFHLAARAFAEIQAYWLPKKSTLTTKARFGYLRHFYGEDNVLEGMLTLGWSWGLASGYGITLDAGVSVLGYPGNFLVAGVNQGTFGLGPVLSLAFEF